jgi:hypothetical protein
MKTIQIEKRETNALEKYHVHEVSKKVLHMNEASSDVSNGDIGDGARMKHQTAKHSHYKNNQPCLASTQTTQQEELPVIIG